MVGPAATSCRFHWPMQGPQALASTVPPIRWKVSSRLSRRIVWKIRSEPGAIRNGTRARRPAARPWRAMWAARCMSSYEEFVQEPISALVMASGQPCSRASAASREMDRPRSGECGPTTCGSSASRLISTSSS